MGERMAHLTRYFVVNRFDEPDTAYPVKKRTTADRECQRLNGPETDMVRGVKRGRPYRVVTLSPSPARGEEDAPDRAEQALRIAVWGALAPHGCPATQDERGWCEPLLCDCSMGDFDTNDDFILWVASVRARLTATEARLAAKEAELEEERARRGSTIGCAFCFMQYPADGSDDDTMIAATRAHVESCEKHPAAEFRKQRDEAVAIAERLVPRRQNLSPQMAEWSIAERAVFEAMLAVEQAGASTALTDAVVLLGYARDKVAEHRLAEIGGEG